MVYMHRCLTFDFDSGGCLGHEVVQQHLRVPAFGKALHEWAHEIKVLLFLPFSGHSVIPEL